MTEGYTKAEGYVASLRQMARWIEYTLDDTAQSSQRVELCDIDTDELKAAADFIERQAAAVRRESKLVDLLEKNMREQGKLLADTGRDVDRLRAALTQFVAACDTAPPTSLMIELGMACNVARAALNGARTTPRDPQ